MYTSSGVEGASFTANSVLIDGVWQTKKRFAKEWAEAEKATQQAEKTEHDVNATKLDVEKVKAARSHQRVGRVLGSLSHLLNFVYPSPSFPSLPSAPVSFSSRRPRTTPTPGRTRPRRAGTTTRRSCRSTTRSKTTSTTRRYRRSST